MKGRKGDRYRTRPVWHPEICQVCNAVFEELSDPSESFHLCRQHFDALFGYKGHQAPLQHKTEFDWWDRFVEEDERRKIAEKGDARE